MSEATLEQEYERLAAECSRCQKCGHIQAEPNWCHRCGHRVTMPEWAAALIDELHEKTMALIAISNETQGHGDVDSPRYDMTLDHIFEVAASAMDAKPLLRVIYNPEIDLRPLSDHKERQQ